MRKLSSDEIEHVNGACGSVGFYPVGFYGFGGCGFGNGGYGGYNKGLDCGDGGKDKGRDDCGDGGKNKGRDDCGDKRKESYGCKW